MCTNIYVYFFVFVISSFSNAFYAKLGGISTSEMNTLEVKFLFILDFKLNVTPSAFYTYLMSVHQQMLMALPQLYMEPSSTVDVLQHSPSEDESTYHAQFAV